MAGVIGEGSATKQGIGQLGFQVRLVEAHDASRVRDINLQIADFVDQGPQKIREEVRRAGPAKRSDVGISAGWKRFGRGQQ